MDIFVSYDYDNDRQYKNTLKMWASNSRVDFTFNDVSIDISVNSRDPGVIKRAISRRIAQSDVVVCIVGRSTNRSSWVRWEIEKAVELRRSIAAVKIEASNPTPESLYGIGAKWAMSFTFESIKNAISAAYLGYDISF